MARKKSKSSEQGGFNEFRENSIAEYFKKNAQMLGYSSKLKSMTTIIHEIVTNSLDACEEAGILPEINVEVIKEQHEMYKIIIDDNGPGIPPEFVPKVFGKMLAGSKMHRNTQSRGQQGIGAAGVLMFAQVTTGKPLKITTSTGDGIIHTIELKMSIESNEGDIISSTTRTGLWTGTQVEGIFKDVTYNKRDNGPFEYLRRIAISTPHAKISIKDPDGETTIFERTSIEVPEKPAEIKTHPYGLTTDELLHMAKASDAVRVSSMLSENLSRVNSNKIKTLLNMVISNNILKIYKNTDQYSILRDKYIAIPIIPYVEKYSEYIIDLDLKNLKELYEDLPNNYADLKLHYQKFFMLDYLLTKLKPEQIQKINTHLKKQPSAFIDYFEKNHMNITALKAINSELLKILAEPEEFLQFVEDNNIMSKTDLKKLTTQSKKILSQKPKKLTWEEAEEIKSSLQSIPFMAPSSNGLRPIGKENIEKSLDTLNPDFLHVISKSPKTYQGGIPFAVEVGVSYGGDSGRKTTDGQKLEIIKYANHVPLLYDTGCGLTNAVNSVNWKRYGVYNESEAPMTIFINLISTHIPYTSAGKQAVATSESDNIEIYNEIRQGLMVCGKHLDAHLSSIRREKEELAKKKHILKYSTLLCEGLANITGKPKEDIEIPLKNLLFEKK